MMLKLVLTFIVAFVSAKEQEKDRRRIFCGGLCLALATTVILTATAGGGAAAAGGKRRRRVDGEMEDSVCTKTMKLVRETPYLKSLLLEEGKGNMLPLEKTVDVVGEACQKLAENGSPMMNQCTFYLSAAQHLDVEILESAWLNAYGSRTDQHHGCGKVVNTVNQIIQNIPNIEKALLENGQEVYVTGNESTSSFRRLIGATASGVIGAGMYLAHVCGSFDESNNLIQSEETIAWN